MDVPVREAPSTRDVAFVDIKGASCICPSGDFTKTGFIFAL
jgi:hypothetical protein